MIRPGALLRAWRVRLREKLRSFPLQRRVALLTSFAVAIAVAVTGMAGYFTLRLALYRSLDSELTEVAEALASPVARNIRNIGGLTEFTLEAGNFSVAVVRADGQVFFVQGEQVHLQVGDEELAVARLHNGVSARSGVATDGRAVPDGGGAAGGPRQLRPGARPAAERHQRHPQLPVDRARAVRRDRGRAGRCRWDGGRPVGPATRTPADGRGGVRRADRRPDPDPGHRQRRRGPAGRLVQPDAGLARLLPRTAAAADRRRGPRAADPADQSADQHRAAVLDATSRC